MELLFWMASLETKASTCGLTSVVNVVALFAERNTFWYSTDASLLYGVLASTGYRAFCGQP